MVPRDLWGQILGGSDSPQEGHAIHGQTVGRSSSYMPGHVPYFIVTLDLAFYYAIMPRVEDVKTAKLYVKRHCETQQEACGSVAASSCTQRASSLAKVYWYCFSPNKASSEYTLVHLSARTCTQNVCMESRVVQSSPKKARENGRTHIYVSVGKSTLRTGHQPQL